MTEIGAKRHSQNLIFRNDQAFGISYRADMETTDWCDFDNDAVLAPNFSMLSVELSRRRYNKAAQNRALHDQIDRSRGSLEFKICNVSAAMRGLGLPIIKGYAPRFNFEMALAKAAARFLAQHTDWEIVLHQNEQHRMAEGAAIFVGVAPTLRNAPTPDKLEQMQRIASRFDAPGGDERNPVAEADPGRAPGTAFLAFR